MYVYEIEARGKWTEEFTVTARNFAKAVEKGRTLAKKAFGIDTDNPRFRIVSVMETRKLSTLFKTRLTP